jgi:hypothetical protein
MASIPQPIVQFERRLPTRVSGSFLQENDRKEEPLPEDILSFSPPRRPTAHSCPSESRRPDERHGSAYRGDGNRQGTHHAGDPQT